MRKSDMIKARALGSIQYADKPLSMGGVVQSLSVAQFQDKFGLKYSEGLAGNPDALREYLSNAHLREHLATKPDLPKLAAVLERLDHPLETLVICNMGPEVGCGLFTQVDIPMDSVLFLYAGEIKDAVAGPDPRGSEYDYSWVSGTNKAVDAKALGNLARFMQHLPVDHEKHKQKLKEGLRARFGSALIQKRGIDLDAFVADLKKDEEPSELDELEFVDKATRASLAVSNVRPVQMLVNGVPCVVCVADYDIKAGTQLGFCYGKHYYFSKKMLFDQFGGLISELKYCPKNANAQDLYKRAVACFKAGDFASAIFYGEKAAKKFSAAAKSPELITCLSTLASSQRDLGKLSEARETCEKALALSVRVHGDSDKTTIALRTKLEGVDSKIAESSAVLRK